jgi:hypothetical protein
MLKKFFFVTCFCISGLQAVEQPTSQEINYQGRYQISSAKTVPGYIRLYLLDSHTGQVWYFDDSKAWNGGWIEPEWKKMPVCPFEEVNQ